LWIQEIGTHSGIVIWLPSGSKDQKLEKSPKVCGWGAEMGKVSCHNQGTHYNGVREYVSKS